MLLRRSRIYIRMNSTPRSENGSRDSIRLVARRRGPNTALIANRDGGLLMSEVLALRARLAQPLDELQRRLATYHSFDDPGAGEAADRIAAVALAIKELDGLLREETSA